MQALLKVQLTKTAAPALGDVCAAPSGLKVVNHGCKKQASGRVPDQSKTEHKDNIGHGQDDTQQVNR
jgi:hypothetical protein